MKVEILEEKRVYDGFFKLEEARLRHERFDGTMSDEMRRLNLERGDAAAALVYDIDAEEFVLVRQFRYPTYGKGPGWTIEVVAGAIDAGETPAQAIRREIEEEVGYQTEALTTIATFYPSPGGSSERIFLYYAEVRRKGRVNEGGGLDHEGEDIVLVRMSREAFIAQAKEGRLQDAKTLMAAFWLER